MGSFLLSDLELDTQEFPNMAIFLFFHEGQQLQKSNHPFFLLSIKIKKPSTYRKEPVRRSQLVLLLLQLKRD